MPFLSRSFFRANLGALLHDRSTQGQHALNGSAYRHRYIVAATLENGLQPTDCRRVEHYSSVVLQLDSRQRLDRRAANHISSEGQESRSQSKPCSMRQM